MSRRVSQTVTIKPEEPLEIFLDAGELYLAEADTRIRSLLGEGGVITLWHPHLKLGGMCHFRNVRMNADEPGGRTLNPAYADAALSLLQLEMVRAGATPRRFEAKLFVFDGPDADKTAKEAGKLLHDFGFKLTLDHNGSGNLVFDVWNGDVWIQKDAPSMIDAGKAPQDILEVYLDPGEWYFSDADTRMKTLLGSCVAVVLWHPQKRLGGMCHYMLPQRNGAASNQGLDGRYADEAMQLLVDALRKERTRPQEYEVKIFGGSSMLEGSSINVSKRNIEAAYRLLKQHGFRLVGEDLGGRAHRNLVFDVWSGDVWLRKGSR
ncbi:Chemotaxis protein, stimulates methylation of MCP protein [Hahella chejuensis KCTC 2396]|uniref:Probable chemoreceptor glutamine deamidase CheD n=1 Tax=Hahella chejuensis (strain KCTC 2396) TaxID=349521 RepID=Q2SFY3_HAHCH|nr:chemotaxis protein, stimulates methylation of MCP protein [Hahella chejuensis]ABC30441.1 Chemotaxis protein, stimulates methylation of MCP protein [Hahella chejuensis KCTC 2396]